MNTDLFVIGGAVGASWGGPAGWAAFIYAPALNLSQKLVDVLPDIRKDEADVLPFVAAIQWYHNTHGFAAEQHHVICVTDSQRLYRAGNLVDPRDSEDWAYIVWFESRGYKIQWVWRSRDENEMVFEDAEHARQQFIRQHTSDQQLVEGSPCILDPPQ